MTNLHPANQMTVRALNSSLILSCLRYQPSLTRANLAKSTGLNRSTVTNLVDDLIKQGFVIETGIQPSSGGRPGIGLSLNPAGGMSIGVEIKDTFISVVLTDFLAQIVWRKTHYFPNPDNYLAFDTLQPEIEALVQSAIDVHAAHNCDLLGIGIGLTGLVNVDEGISIHSPNLGWRNLPIRDIFEDRFKLPVFVGNGAALAALSERHYGLSQDVQNSIYVATSHTGVGSGIFINNQLFHGVRGYAGEIGHMVVNPAGTRCGCGRIGCWETEIGERHIAQRLIARIAAGEKSILADQTDITLRGILNAAAQDDALAIETIDTLCRMLGLGLANLVNIFNPDMIVLGGIFRDLPQPCIARVQQIVESEAMGVASSGIQIIRGALPMEDACVLGAAALVLDDVLRVPTFHAIR